MAALLHWWLLSRCPLRGLPSLRALGALAGYALLVAVLGALLPGPRVPGTVLSDGSRLSYKCSGLLVAVSCVAVLFGGWTSGAISRTAVADIAGELFATALAFSLALSLWLQFVGSSSKAVSASLKRRSHGSVLLDFWLGTQLNPRALGVLDLKWFCLRLGMLGWLILNLAAAAKQHHAQGALSAPMLLYQLFTGIYVLDFFWFEEAMTTTWDIIAECFGFMLALGDLVWIPFTFSLQAWWLLDHDVHISPVFGAFAALVFLVGFAVFRGSNRQKHLFKKDPSVAIWGQKPKVIGGRLLASGYWGLARHCNYMGDLLLALSFSLPCGLSSAVPYFYFLYLFVLLVQRERRDEAKCREKYKEVWKEYCDAVPWRMFPLIY